MLLVLFVLGIVLVVVGVLMTCFPRALDDLSNWLSQTIINLESAVSKRRMPMGILIFILGVLMMWVAQTSRF